MAEGEMDDKPFLSRWSERKRQVRVEEERPADARAAEGPAAQPGQEELEANRAVAEAIDISTLTDTSDYAPFFRPGVPTALKNAALQKLWRSNPVFAVLDGLDDHFLDFRWEQDSNEVVRTAWKVGRGFLTEEDQADASPRAEAPAARPVAARAEPEAEEAKASADPQQAVTADEEPREAAEAGDPEREIAPEPEQAKVGLARRLDFAAFAKETRES